MNTTKRKESSVTRISRSIVVAAAMLVSVAGCSKPDPVASTASSASATSTVAATAPGQAPTPPAATKQDDDRGGNMMPGMPAGMSMDGGHMHDGGMGHPMPNHPMPGHM